MNTKRMLAGVAIAFAATSVTVPAVVVMPAAQAAIAGYPTMNLNARGTNVEALQHLLNANGAQLSIDGSYGPRTKAAVSDFQRAKKLKIDGSAGPQTLTAITPDLKKGAKGSSTKALQTLLVKNGSNILVDGSFGPATERAVKAFNDKHKTGAGTVANENTWKKLFSESAGNGGGNNGGNVGGGAGTYAGVNLSAEQVRMARTIIAVGKGNGFDRKGQAIALMTAMQESTLKNINHGDRDSLGLFQQRPSMGWGSRAQITDPVMSSRAFYGVASHTNNPGLQDVRGWQSMEEWYAAYKVQRCAYEYRTYYNKHKAMAYALIDRNGDVKPIE